MKPSDRLRKEMMCIYMSDWNVAPPPQATSNGTLAMLDQNGC